MQQLTVTAPRQLEWLDVEEPELASPQAAVVRPIAVATCDFDHLISRGRTSMPMPIAIGHESVATVVEVGSDVTKVRPGDIVVVPFQISCGACTQCLRGNTSSCEEVPWLSCYGLGPGSGNYGGAVADLLMVPYADAMLVPLPDGVSPIDAAPAACNIPDAYRAVVPQLRENPGAPVLIMSGAFENVALYATALALAFGASRVDYLHPNPDRAVRAAVQGANVLRSTAEVKLRSYPITVDASQDPDLLSLAIRATAPDGVCTVSTMYPGKATPLPLMDMFAGYLTLRTGQPHARALLPEVLGVLAEGRLQPRLVTSTLVGWDSAPTAFNAGAGKIVCVRE